MTSKKITDNQVVKLISYTKGLKTNPLVPETNYFFQEAMVGCLEELLAFRSEFKRNVVI
jgi:hypothetical protein